MVTPRTYKSADQNDVIALWQACGLTRPWNDPELDIQRKLTDVHPFWVLEDQHQIVGSIMVGYDGHRGSVNYLAVAPSHQGRGLGRLLMERAQHYLTDLAAQN